MLGRRQTPSTDSGPVYTPHGLKLRLTVKDAFSMIGQLYPRVRPKEVFLATEAISNIPTVLSHVIFLVALSAGANPWVTIVATAIGTLWGLFVVWCGAFFLAPGALMVAKVFSIPFAAYLRYIIMPVLAYSLRGWNGVFIWLGAWIVASLIGWVVEFCLIRRLYSKTSLPTTMSEVAFLQACRLHALALGMDWKQLGQDSDEIDWLSPATEYAFEYPNHLPYSFVASIFSSGEEP
ncbi:hypothetical protein [Candidatus Caldatribacterium saccharofermentans]|uniref:hypothetical protein n=1 Tax=Candidatus Caldatribacterium saccharofermentans TaxID=1454753 RepID=UPI003CFD0A15